MSEDQQIHQTAMANNDNCDDSSHEMEETGIPELHCELQNAAIDEMNNLGFNVDQGDDVVNDDVSEMTGQDEDSVRGDDEASAAPSVAS